MKLRLWLTAGMVVLLLLAGVHIVAAPPEKFSVNLPLPTDLLAALISSESAAADPSVFQIGPVPSTSPDGGTCGSPWADDTFNRFFTIKATSNPRQFTVYEKFKDGTFVTFAGPSPGACDNSDGTPPGTISAGVNGTMHGYILTNVTCDPALPTCPDPSAVCGGINDVCQTTNGFIAAFFGPNALRNDVSYFFHYAGYDGSNQGLIFHEWKNASANRGCNHGDIADAAAPTIVATNQCF